MEIEQLIIFAPCAVFVVVLLIQLGIFARTSEVKAIEAKLMTYAMEHFVTKDTYSLNHKALQDNLAQIREDISDVRNLLINFANHQRGN